MTKRNDNSKFSPMPVKSVTAYGGGKPRWTKPKQLVAMKTPISYYGGKQQLLTTILPLIPEHRVYTETFFGGGAVYWAKKPSKTEIINDYNGNVVNFYKILETRFHELNALIKATLHSHDTHKLAVTVYAMPV